MDTSAATAAGAQLVAPRAAAYVGSIGMLANGCRLAATEPSAWLIAVTVKGTWDLSELFWMTIQFPKTPRDVVADSPAIGFTLAAFHDVSKVNCPVDEMM